MHRLVIMIIIIRVILIAPPTVTQG
jgi:hypothetical protein